MYFPQDLKYDSILCRFVLAIALHLEVSVAFMFGLGRDLCLRRVDFELKWQKKLLTFWWHALFLLAGAFIWLPASHPFPKHFEGYSLLSNHCWYCLCAMEYIPEKWSLYFLPNKRASVTDQLLTSWLCRSFWKRLRTKCTYLFFTTFVVQLGIWILDFS